jgi:mono/diheme cytochrome c family protein
VTAAWRCAIGLLAGLSANITAGAETSGEAIYNRECVQCHGPGLESTGTQQLARTRGEDKALLTERDDLEAAYIEYVVRHGLRAMPPFAPAGLTDDELAALTEYLIP